MSQFSCERIGFEEGPYGAACSNEQRMCKWGKHPCRASECRKKWHQQCRNHAPLTYVSILMREDCLVIQAIGPNQDDWPDRASKLT